MKKLFDKAKFNPRRFLYLRQNSSWVKLLTEVYLFFESSFLLELNISKQTAIRCQNSHWNTSVFHIQKKMFDLEQDLFKKSFWVGH